MTDPAPSPPRQLRVLHVVPGLGVGGAERLLLSLVRETTDEVQHMVASLGGEQPLAQELRDAGAQVQLLAAQRPARLLSVSRAVRRIVKEFRPHVVQGWLYHGNLVATLAAGRTPLVWSIHHTNLTRDDPWHTRLAFRLGVRLSQRPRRIIYAAESSCHVHEKAGYCADRGLVVPNGVDTGHFRPPSPEERQEASRALGIPLDALVVGRGGRFHPMKDYPTYLEACRILLAGEPRLHCIAWGEGVTPENPAFHSALAGLGTGASRLHLLGPLLDSRLPLWALDVAASSSSGEAMPLIVLEAMACGVPCVVTDVGDSARIVGNTGVVVPPGRPDLLAHGMEGLFAKSPAERERLGRAAQERAAGFSIAACARRYEAVWQEVTGATLPGRR